MATRRKKPTAKNRKRNNRLRKTGLLAELDRTEAIMSKAREFPNAEQREVMAAHMLKLFKPDPELPEESASFLKLPAKSQLKRAIEVMGELAETKNARLDSELVELKAGRTTWVFQHLQLKIEQLDAIRQTYNHTDQDSLCLAAFAERERAREAWATGSLDRMEDYLDRWEMGLRCAAAEGLYRWLKVVANTTNPNALRHIAPSLATLLGVGEAKVSQALDNHAGDIKADGPRKGADSVIAECCGVSAKTISRFRAELERAELIVYEGIAAEALEHADEEARDESFWKAVSSRGR